MYIKNSAIRYTTSFKLTTIIKSSITVIILCCTLITFIKTPAACGQGGLPYSIEAPPGSVHFGSAVASGGDADADGIDDIFIIDPGYINDEGDVSGRWFMYSSANMKPLWQRTGTLINDGYYAYGMNACFIDDLDNDDCDDIILGIPGLQNDQGAVAIFSGRTGNLIYDYIGDTNNYRMGGDVTALPDINSDNVPDFAYVSKFTSDGEVIVRSGKTGDVISTLYKYLPRRIHSISDINNDGTAEIVIGSNDRKKDCPISVYSIVDSQLIMEYKAPQGEQDFDFGYNFVCNADVTNDDIPDLLAVGRLAFGLYASRVYVISGSDGSVISTIEINNDYSGVYLKYADVNGDGNTDVVIGSKFNIYVNEPDTGLLIHTLQTYTTKGENIWGTEYAIADLNDDGMDDFIAGVTLSDELVTQVNLVGGGRLLMYSQNLGRKYTIQPDNSYEFIIHGDLPGRNVRILASKIGSGCTNVPRYGLCIDLDRPIYSLGTAVTEEIDNNAYITLDVPGKFIQGNMWIQAVDPNHDTLGPITSNVIKLKVEE